MYGVKRDDAEGGDFVAGRSSGRPNVPRFCCGPRIVVLGRRQIYEPRPGCSKRRLASNLVEFGRI
jgi:hypothetical protein